MIQKVNVLTDDMIQYAFESQMRPESCVCPYMEDPKEYRKFLENEFKYDDFYVLQEEKVIGLLIVNPDANNQIYGLWADTYDAKERLMAFAVDTYKTVIIYGMRENKDIGKLALAYGLVVDTEEVVLEIEEKLPHILDKRIERERVSKENFNHYKKTIDTYFSDCFWNDDRLVDTLDWRHTFAYKQGGEIVGVTVANVYDDKNAEVQGIGAKNQEIYYEIYSDLLDLLTHVSKKVLIFAESQDDVHFLKELGFRVQYEAVFYVSKEIQKERENQ